MAPKVNCQPAKLASIVTWLQKSKVCHSIKDLEKHLPSVASINGMQVKDYVQALQDESKITCEKIGSGNWYWSFASQAKNEKQRALTQAQTEHEKATTVVQDLRHKLAEASAAMADEEDSEESREELMAQKAVLEADLKALQKELAAYSDNDPTELERKKEETKKLLMEVEQFSDDIMSMEGWVKNEAGSDAVAAWRVNFYGDEYDVEEEQLREIVLDVK